ncbi:hypothetical protein [Paraglaciecola polaris]|uniref:DUF2946 domain-containing protein n=1 Tax=Paraglaciecola polaris LMG 21857 TaxID=1129793 RepID=K7AF67_9ALTE|nr:hypothetical protein [Paraglaciecola polaris]GAC33945.1 hypothetical protein GPLA_3052 [Paraglaciecola polaris LMG 21857]
MKFKLIAYSMLFVIALQSLAAVAKAQDFHQIEPEHLALIHQHASDEQNISLTPSLNDEQVSTQDDTHNPADCHHCGHCNGSHAHWVSASASPVSDIHNTVSQYAYLHTLVDGPANRLLRPPKA